MFEGLERKRATIPRRVAVWAAVIGAFGAGLGAGKLLAGARPFDWTLEILDFAFIIGFTVWFAVAATRNGGSGR
jgi:hypothetical protein